MRSLRDFCCLSLSVLFILLLGTTAVAQTITSLQDGPWNSSNTWSGGTIPTAGNSSAIVIQHAVTVPAAYAVTIDETTVTSIGSVTVNSGGTLTIASVPAALTVNGTLIGANGSNITGTDGTNVVFGAGSRYQHLFTTAQGVLPLASWNATSTAEILGYTTFSNATVAGNWSQTFGNFVWNCTGQTATVSLNGLVTSIAGSLSVPSTGAALLNLSTSQNPTVTIGGNLEISGTSRVGLSSTGAAPGATYNIAGDFIFTSTSAVGSQTNTTGVCTVNIGGDFSMNANGGLLRLATTPGGTGVGTLNVAGNFEIIAGTISETANAPGNGNINFVGSQPQTFYNEPSSSTVGIVNQINYNIGASNTVRVLGESKISGNGASVLNLAGTLIVESTNTTGAIVNGNSLGVGNVRTGVRNYSAGARIVYGGSAPQFIGTGHPTAASVDCEINNPAGVTQVSGTTITLGNDLIVTDGTYNLTGASVTISGDLLLPGGDMIMDNNSTADRTLTVNGNIDLDGGVQITGNGTRNATLVINGTLSGSNFITFSGAQAQLQINGTGDLGVTFPLPGPTSLELVQIDRPGATINFAESLTAVDFTVSNGEVDMDAALTVTDDLNLASGTTLFFEDQTLTLGSQYNNSLTGGLLSSNANAALVLNGGGVLGTLDFSPSGNVLGDFTINRTTGGNLVTLNSVLSVVNTFNLVDGQFTNTSGLDFASGAVITRNSAATLVGAAPTGGPYDLILTGSNMTTSAAAAGLINDLTSNSTGTVTLGTSVTAVGTFTINSGVMTAGANAVTALDLINNGTFNAPSTTLTIGGSFTNDGTFNRNGGTVIFNGEATILGSSNPSFQNLVVNGDFSAPATLNIHGSLTNNGVFTAGTTVAFLGTAGVTQVVDGTNPITFFNMNVTNTTAAPDVTLESSQNLAGVLTLATNATLDADGAADNAVFTLLSTNDNPAQDGSIAALAGASQIIGNITVQRFMSGEGRMYRYISSPVSGATVASWQDDFTITGTFTDPSTSPASICDVAVIPANPSMYLYDETQSTTGTSDNGWRAYPTSGLAADNQLEVGRGYSPFIRECTVPTLIDVTGTANQGNVNVTLRYTNTGDAALDGYNLVGNPYPSAINWQAAGWSRSGAIGSVIAIRDNGAGGTYTYFDYSDGSTNDLIASGQAFWVRTSVDNQVLGFRETTKTSQNAVFYRSSGDNVLTIALKRGTVTDKAFVKLNSSAKATIDRYDGPKLNNATFDFATLSQEAVPMAINAVDQIACGTAMPLHFKFVSNPNGNYAMEFQPNGAFKGFRIQLFDAHTGKTVNVTQNPVYNYTVDNTASSRAANRFKILFEQNSVEMAATVSATCADDANAAITLKGSQYGIRYFATIDGVVSSDTLEGSGADRILYLAAEKLKPGANQVTVQAIGQCQSNTMDVEVFKTSGVEIVDAGIGQLQSTAESGNQWYYNDALIEGATLSTLAATEAGTYRVEATVNGCVSSAEYEFIVLNTEAGRSQGIQIFPNPVETDAVVRVKDTSVQGVDLYNNWGTKLEAQKFNGTRSQTETTINMARYPAGVYFVKVLGSNYIRTVKIVKK